ncbi:MAG TPA: tetratricopeptide repeat protein [Candidatus Sumerlaeota bacterium]|nr:tetratricopeptide repeat protein [Candidatus Sumerlaeota bacterium]
MTLKPPKTKIRTPKPDSRTRPHASTSDKRRLVVAALLLAALIIAYAPSLRGDFLWDDDDYVVNNGTLRNVKGLLRIWIEPGAVPQYYPMTHSTFWAEYNLWGLRPTGYRITNLLLHAASALLLMVILKRLGMAGAMLAGILFALHPVHVESVAWITERKNCLSGFLYLTSFFFLARFYGLFDPVGGERREGRRKDYSIALALFAAALFSKTVACSLPAALLILVWWKRGKVRGGDVLKLAPFFALGLILGIATILMERHHVGAGGAAFDLSWAQRAIIAGRALWFYFGKLAWPHPLVFIYPRWNPEAFGIFDAAAPVAALATAGALWFRRDRIGRGPLAAALFFGATLFPALGFFDVYPMQFSFVADHFQYLASLGPIVLFSAVLASALKKHLHPSGEITACVVIGATLALVTWNQSHIYRNLESLWRHTLRHNPESWMPLNNLGREMARQGRIEEALEYYKHAETLTPDDDILQYNLGTVLLNLRRPDEAEGHFRKAVRLNPDYPDAWGNLGLTLLFANRPDEALSCMDRALQMRTGAAWLHTGRAKALAALGRIDEARGEFRKALGLETDGEERDKINFAMGFMEFEAGNLAASEDIFRDYLSRNPDSPRAYEILGTICSMRQDWKGAETHFRRATELTPGDPDHFFNLGRALMEQGRREEAYVVWRRVYEINPDDERIQKMRPMPDQLP